MLKSASKLKVVLSISRQTIEYDIYVKRQKEMIKKLLRHVKEYKTPSILAPFFVGCEVVLEVLIPFMMTEIVSSAEDNAFERLLIFGGIMIAMSMLSLFFGSMAGYCSAVAGMGFSKNLRQAIFEAIQAFSFSNVDKFSTASLIIRQSTDVNNVQMAYMMSIRMLVRSPFMMTGGIIMAFVVAPKLAPLFLIAVPIIFGGLMFLSLKAFPRFQVMFRKYDKMDKELQENLIGIRVVKAFVRADHETKEFKAASEDLRDKQMKAEKFLIFMSPVLNLGVYVCTLVILAVGGKQVTEGAVEATSLMALLTYVMQILMSLMMLSMVTMTLVISKESAERIIEVLDEKPSISDEDADETLVVKDGSIEFDNVSFSYSGVGGVNALENVNLKIASGQTIGIIGGTGSSKTTLVQLIPRLYDVTEGSLKIAGEDVRKYKISTLREEVAMVLQKNVLFSGSIKENLLWGNENASDEEIIEAAKAAQAHDFIMGFADGYEHDLGQGGVNVSGGQKQRLCIARALLKKPKIMILDDSTSAVDTATDAKIRHALKEKLSDMTVIIIAQRISSVADADQIIVLDDGKIDGVGTHEELLKTNTIYQEVYESQQQGEDE